MQGISPAFLREVKPYVKLIAGQIACPIALQADFRHYDLVLTSFPHFVERFRSQGLVSEYFKLAFEPRVLAQLRKGNVPYQLVFVGGITPHHRERIRLLEHIARSHQLGLWGYGIDTLNVKSPLRSSFRGQAWGRDMYNIFYNARIVLNHHINVADSFANNMRLYEATGVGALLLTDHKDNLHTLFEPGNEVVVYRSAEECVELITHYLAHEEEGSAVALAGQERTLREHTYYERMQEMVDIVCRYL
jgi:hypothetical protein